MNAAKHNDVEALYAITRALHGIEEQQALLETVLQQAMAHLGAERGSLVLIDATSDKGYSVIAVGHPNDSGSAGAFVASSSVLQQVLTTGEPVLTFDALTDGRFESSTSIIAHKVLSILCIPLRTGDAIIGAVYLDSSSSRKAFTEDAVKFLTVFGHLAAVTLENVRRTASLRDENLRLRHEVDVARQFTSMIGNSPAWRQVLSKVQRVLDVDVPVLITGESGTGKELVARAIHDHGIRRTQPFVSVNCSALPAGLIESELFGHVRGAFTGAAGDKKGLVEAAHGGTLFLDEIADLPLELQPKILRLLQEKEYRRVGDTRNRAADVRIVAATNKDPKTETAAQRLREDLYFRLNVVGIHLPPLRERKEDIAVLAEHFLRWSASEHRRPVTAIQPAALSVLIQNPWPGNVRELRNTMERAVILSTGSTLTMEDVVLETSLGTSRQPSGSTLEDLERGIIEAALAANDGNRTRTAEQLGVSLRWLQYRLKEWGAG